MEFSTISKQNSLKSVICTLICFSEALLQRITCLLAHPKRHFEYAANPCTVGKKLRCKLVCSQSLGKHLTSFENQFAVCITGNADVFKMQNGRCRKVKQLTVYLCYIYRIAGWHDPRSSPVWKQRKQAKRLAKRISLNKTVSISPNERMNHQPPPETKSCHLRIGLPSN